MPRYKCYICGENFPGALVGESNPVGFYVTRFVEAISREEAEMQALARLKNEQRLSLPQGMERPKNARLHFENIEEVEHAEVPDTDSGFTFFAMGT